MNTIFLEIYSEVFPILLREYSPHNLKITLEEVLFSMKI